MKLNRRDFLKTGALASAAGIMMTNANASLFVPHGDTFALPRMPYPFEALEPHIDAKTMELHYGRHHAGYVKKVNEVLAPMHLHHITIEEVCKGISKFDEAVRNNGGGHYNHSAFWKMMKPGGGGAPSGKIAEAINGAFGDFEKFKKQFADAAMKRFGSGWAWLVKGADGKLAIGSTPNQDNPLMDVAEFKGSPVLALDVWEHAYYLKYNNKRDEYINAFWNVVNWDEAARLLG